MNRGDISFIIPVYNRPEEIQELLDSFVNLEGNKDFEIVIVEDGSTQSSKSVIDEFNKFLNITYFFKENSGPGNSRNYGMKRAKGNYFIILDSDCVLPPTYLTIVLNSLNSHFFDCYGGPDAAHESFTNLQKAINFSMTSFITTGGIRGKKGSIDKFQPRSFNMGISKEAFLATQGFGRIHPGEDPDLSIRLERLGFKTVLIPEAFVYHKRRISWLKFYKQVNKFGMVRAILNMWHPHTKKLLFWLPTLFLMGLVLSLLLSIIGMKIPILIYVSFFILIFLISLKTTKSIEVAALSIIAVCIQFIGYGYGFFKSNAILNNSSKNVEELFPKLFFKEKE
jgi:glycosyltransferase involved in cell wall biosynthesis